MAQKKLKLHTIPDWDQPRNGFFKILKDRWWVVDESGNPLFYSEANHPQCNADREIAIKVAWTLDLGYEVKQLPIVYIPINPNNY